MNASAAAEKVTIGFDAKVPQAGFAAGEIEAALKKTGHEAVGEGGGWRIAFQPVEAALGREAYRVRVEGRRTEVVGGDATGLMYGGLEVAEAIRLGGGPQGVRATEGRPHVLRRGIKFNIPLDARTPSYSDASDSARQNIPEMWSMDFWREMLDAMARHRYNVLTLWSLHPFPSMVKVPEYPDVALDDVMTTTAPLDTDYALTGHNMVRKDTLENLQLVRKMTMDQKIAFWRQVMQHARDRGIEVYIFTWNIFVWGADGKYGITHEQDNPKTIDYFRKSVREMVRTYPLLAGIGITAGERMKKRKDEFDKEKWLWKAYGEGICDALKEQPDRHVRLIHRYHQTALREILDEWKNYPGTFDLSYKYAVAHMYADPAPPFAERALKELPKNLRMWMTVRNDDIYSFRWGDPDFARAFIRALPGQDQLAGHYIGPDGYTWGREFISTEPGKPRELVIRKQWYTFLLWGRLSYDPDLPNSLFQQILASHFPQVDGGKLYRAFAEASRIIPQVNRFYWEDFDFQWFPEACISHPKYKGFHCVRRFMDGKPVRGVDILSIKAYCDLTLKGETTRSMTPLQVAGALKGHADATLALVAELGSAEDMELRLTLGDLTAMAHLGRYYAEKILGATELSFHDKTGKEEHLTQSIRHLEAALTHWNAYAAVVGTQYQAQFLTRLGRVDLKAITADVENDIKIAREWKRQGR